LASCSDTEKEGCGSFPWHEGKKCEDDPSPRCTNCSAGCCGGTTCVSSPNDDSCGTDGAPCVACGGGTHCKTGKCV
jgi:hypothetical protein